MKVLVIGSGGREHTLAWKLAQSADVTEVFTAPGNSGTAKEPKCRNIDIASENVPELLKFAREENIDLTVVGPEAPLVAGVADAFSAAGLKVFGPSAKAAMLEGSKVFAKELMAKYNIPSAPFEVFDEYAAAERYLKGRSGPIVLKADGLAAGKGVFVCADQEQSLAALNSILRDKVFGAAGNKVVIEECLQGEEASFIAFTDGETVLPLAGSQDHKAIFDNDCGPNTGGMGAYSPAPVITPEIHDKVMSGIMIPTVQALKSEGVPFSGFLYAGLMIKDGEASALEFNVRMGDPEAQPLLYRLKSDLTPTLMAAVEGRLQGETLEWFSEDAVCVVMAAGGYPGDYKKGYPITGIEEAERLGDVKVFHAGAALKDGRLVSWGGRVLGVTAKAKGIAAAIDLVYQGVDKITWENVQYRRDIGRKALLRGQV